MIWYTESSTTDVNPDLGMDKRNLPLTANIYPQAQPSSPKQAQGVLNRKSK